MEISKAEGTALSGRVEVALPPGVVTLLGSAGLVAIVARVILRVFGEHR